MADKNKEEETKQEVETVEEETTDIQPEEETKTKEVVASDKQEATPEEVATTTETDKGVADIVDSNMSKAEEYIDKLTSKEDVKLYIDLVDKGLNPDKAFETLNKITERNKPVEKEEAPVEISSTEDIVNKYL